MDKKPLITCHVSRLSNVVAFTYDLISTHHHPNKYMKQPILYTHTITHSNESNLSHYSPFPTAFRAVHTTILLYTNDVFASLRMRTNGSNACRLWVLAALSRMKLELLQYLSKSGMASVLKFGLFQRPKV